MAMRIDRRSGSVCVARIAFHQDHVLEDGFMSADPNMQIQPLTISVEEAGRLLGISRGLAYGLVRRGEIPSVKLGRRILIPARAIDDLLAGAHQLRSA